MKNYFEALSSLPDFRNHLPQCDVVDDGYVKLIRLHVSYAARLKKFNILKMLLESREVASVEFLHNEVLIFTEGIESMSKLLSRHLEITKGPLEGPFRKTPLRWAVENKNM